MCHCLTKAYVWAGDTIGMDLDDDAQPFERLEREDRPYVFRDEKVALPAYDGEEREVVIVDGQAMSFRSYRR